MFLTLDCRDYCDNEREKKKKERRQKNENGKEKENKTSRARAASKGCRVSDPSFHTLHLTGSLDRLHVRKTVLDKQLDLYRNVRISIVKSARLDEGDALHTLRLRVQGSAAVCQIWTSKLVWPGVCLKQPGTHLLSQRKEHAACQNWPSEHTSSACPQQFSVQRSGLQHAKATLHRTISGSRCSDRLP